MVVKFFHLCLFLKLVIAVLSQESHYAFGQKDEQFGVHLPHTDPNNAGDWHLQDSFSDEFNNHVVDDIWHRQGADDGTEQFYNRNRGRNSQFIPEAITQRDGMLKIESKWDPKFQFAKGYGTPPITTGALISKQFLQYGYMEIRCRVGKCPMSGAFWSVGNGNRGELDIFEHVGQGWDPARDNEDLPRTMQMSIHNWNRAIDANIVHRRHWTHKHTLDFDVTDGMHVYAADWTENWIKFYVDGPLVRELTKEEANKAKINNLGAWVIDRPQRVWIDCELFDWEGSISALKPEMFDDDAVFEVDYVRVWKRGPAAKQTAEEKEGPNLIRNGSFQLNLDHWETTGMSKIQDVTKWKFWKDNNPSEDVNVMQIGAGGKGTATQTIAVKPDTTYLLAAHLRTPGTTGTLEPANLRQPPLVFQEGWMGVADYGGERKVRKVFHNWFQSYSIEFTTGKTNTTAQIFFNNTETQRGGLLHVDEVSVKEMVDMRVVATER